VSEPVPFDPTTDEIGWQIIDPDGNVVDSGPVTTAELTTDVLEKLLADKEGT